MQKKTVSRDVFVTDDGKEFDSVEKATAHESRKTVLKKYRKVELNESYDAIYIDDLKTAQTDLKSVFIGLDSNDIVKGWNLVYSQDNNSCTCYSIEKLIKTLKAPVLTDDELKSVAQYKLDVDSIIKRNVAMQGSPQAVMGNMIMELQDLITR